MATKIGYFIPQFPTQTHIFFWREMKALAELGIVCDLISTRLPDARIMSHSWSAEAQSQTHYLSPPKPGNLLKGGVELLRSGPLGWWRCLAAVAKADGVNAKSRLKLLATVPFGAMLSAYARSKGLQHVHVHSCAETANVALFARLISGLSYSITLHGPLEDYGANQQQKWRNAEFAIVITRKLEREVREEAPGLANLPPVVAVAGMGVDTDKMNRTAPYEPYQPGSPCRIFSCGRLNRCKGHEDLIRAVGLLRARGIDARLEIAGEIDSPTSDHRAHLERVIADLNLGDSVKLLGALSEERVREGFERAQVFSLASHHEPLGVAIMEAMAMQLPVVVTRAGGVPELVDEGVEGYFVPPENPEALAEAIERVIADPDRATAMGRAGREKIQRSFSHHVSARTIDSCLKQVLNPQGR